VVKGAEEVREVPDVEEVRCEEVQEAVGGGQKTEVYENFELEILRPEVKRKPYTPIEFSQPEELNTFTASPPFTFLTELKSTLTQRTTAPTDFIYKDFDASTGTFRVITKAERDQKERDLDAKLRMRAEEERRERLREEGERQEMLRGLSGGSGMGSLFAELRQRRKGGEEGDEVFE
jgi:hypothetical protein